MPKTLQLRRGNTSFITANTPAQGELLVNTDTNEVRVGDGNLYGGWPLATQDWVWTNSGSLTSNNTFTQYGNWYNGMSSYWNGNTLTIYLQYGAPNDFVANLRNLHAGSTLYINDDNYGSQTITLNSNWSSTPTPSTSISATTTTMSPGILTNLNTIIIPVKTLPKSTGNYTFVANNISLPQEATGVLNVSRYGSKFLSNFVRFTDYAAATTTALNQLVIYSPSAEILNLIKNGMPIVVLDNVQQQYISATILSYQISGTNLIIYTNESNFFIASNINSISFYSVPGVMPSTFTFANTGQFSTDSLSSNTAYVASLYFSKNIITPANTGAYGTTTQPVVVNGDLSVLGNFTLSSQFVQSYITSYGSFIAKVNSKYLVRANQSNFSETIQIVLPATPNYGDVIDFYLTPDSNQANIRFDAGAGKSIQGGSRYFTPASVWYKYEFIYVISPTGVPGWYVVQSPSANANGG